MAKLARVFVPFLSVLAGASCTGDHAAPSPPRTTTISEAGGIARSADGVVEVEIAEGSLITPLDITIELVAGARAPGMVTGAYRITPARWFFKGVEIRMFVPGVIPEDHLAIATLSGGSGDSAEPVELATSIHSPVQAFVSAHVEAIQEAPYAAVDRPWVACANRACGEGCSPCAPSEPLCAQRTAAAFCDSSGACVTGAPRSCAIEGEIAGWNNTLGAGDSLVMSSIRFGNYGDLAFDLDGACAAPGRCGDDQIGLGLGELANDQLRQGLLGGETLVLFEFSGLAKLDRGDTSAATLELYSGRDADDPFFPANNFKAPPGHDICCQFRAHVDSLDGAMQAKTRIPIRRAGERIISAAPSELDLILLLGVPPFFSLRMKRVFVSFTFADGVLSGAVGGAITVNNLAEICNPYCRTLNEYCDPSEGVGRMLDVIAKVTRPQPDVDLDGDGLELVGDLDDNGTVDVCWDGCIGACSAPVEVPPIDPADPGSCALRPEMADGYSVAFLVTAVPASIVGVDDLGH